MPCYKAGRCFVFIVQPPVARWIGGGEILSVRSHVEILHEFRQPDAQTVQ